ncbi:cysteine synthase family protein [Microbacterium protaetiae]|uniref:Cysteine synthase family protein n=1 Tax=Microbacterium protaetiae TaxID=2509458 RepID=A0A4P6EB73_9MICO|nr:cysteine synthase family protein [Microbacterium protaetiae]QAY59375.1 cysteine synthase family protein [Microbacterium protaetiae]
MSTVALENTVDLPDFPDPAAARVYDDAFGLVGNTPLVRINRVAKDAAAPVYVKLDAYNLGGSSKDRIGINIVREAIGSGELKPGQRIVDFGAGNTAIGYALAGQATGHPVTIVANPTLSPEKANLLRLLGVDIVPGRSDVPAGHPDHWAAIAERYEREDPSNWWARQESATSNPHSHALSTGPEIWAQTGGRVTHFLAAVATGGTVSGTGAHLKAQNPDVQVIATDFAEKADKTNARAYIERHRGFEQLERDFPANYDLDVLDRLETRTKAEVIAFGWEVARTEGLLLGTSSILSLLVALEIARTASPDDVIVSFAADSGRDYLTREYNAPWLRENGFGEIADRFA